MKPLLVAFLIISGLSLAAQEAEELWSGTATMRLSTSAKQPVKNDIQQVLYRSPYDDQAKVLDISENSLGTMMFKALIKHRLTGYADVELKTPLTDNQVEETFFGVDTFRFNDSHYREVPYELVAREPKPETYHWVDLNLRISYHSDGSIQQNALSISLNNGDMDEETPIIFLPFELLQSVLPVSEPGWNTVNRMSFQIPFDSLKTRTTSKLTLFESMEHLHELIVSTEGKEFRNLSDWGTDLAYELDQISGEPSCMSMAVDPITYELPKYAYLVRSLATQADKLKLYQFWAWNDQTARFVISPIGYAPVSEERDENGNLLYDRPLINWAHPWYRKN